MSHMEAEFRLQQFLRSLPRRENALLAAGTDDRGGRGTTVGLARVRLRSLVRRALVCRDGDGLRHTASTGLIGGFSRGEIPRTRCG